MAAKKTLEITTEVKDVLTSAAFHGSLLTLPYQLDRELYKQVMKICEAYGGKWDRGRDGIVFANAGQLEKLKAALQTGVAVREKVVAQAYYTPEKAADFLVRHVLGDASPLRVDIPDMQMELRVLEPSCGNGALIRMLASKLPGYCDVTGVELDRAQYLELLENLPLKVNLAAWCFLNEDFLSITPGKGDMKDFDLVLMNSPWTGGQAEKHFLHALKFLRKGGVLGAIVPGNFSPDFAEPQQWASYEDHELPEGSFKESGTNVRAKIVVVRT